jgi:excinuclease UvrABC nuclease subunit
LLRKFGSIEAIKETSSEELSQTEGINPSLAQKVKEYLKNSPML